MLNAAAELVSGWMFDYRNPLFQQGWQGVNSVRLPPTEQEGEKLPPQCCWHHCCCIKWFTAVD